MILFEYHLNWATAMDSVVSNHRTHKVETMLMSADNPCE